VEIHNWLVPNISSLEEEVEKKRRRRRRRKRIVRGKGEEHIY